MNLFAKSGIAAAIALSLTGFAFATGTTAVIKVSLQGEADQPMAIKVDKPTIKAGPVEFEVTNEAMGTDHEMVLIKLKKDQQVMANMKSHRVDEKMLKSMGEVADLKSGDNGKLKVKLAAGDYLLLCNVKGHFEHGMSTPITVTN